MNKELSIVGRFAERYSDRPVIRSLLQLCPGWDSADTLLQKRADEIHADKVKTFFDELSDGKHDLNDELIKDEPFLHSFMCTMKAVVNTRQQEKIRLFARLLDASLSPNMGCVPDEYDELLSVLDSVSLREYRALLSLSMLEEEYPKLEGESEVQNALRYWIHYRLKTTQSLEIPDIAFPAFMAKIERTGLYLRITGGYLDYEGDMGRTTELFGRLHQFVKDRSPKRS